MLSLLELKRAARVIDRDLAGSRVQRWVQPDGERLVVTLYGRDAEGEAHKRHLLLCAAAGVGRASELSAPLAAAPRPPALAAYLRAHLGRARLVRAEILESDRQLAIRFESQEGDFTLLLSLFGRRSNVYLLDAEGNLLVTLRTLEETRPELALGQPFKSPSRGLSDEGVDRFAAASDAGYLGAIEAEYAEQESARGAEDLARRLAKVLRKERKNAERRCERVEAELAEADDVAGLQRQGDLLKGVLGQIAPGQTEITVHDYDRDADVVIPLDPKLSAKGNLEATFKRYQKLIRRLTKAGGRVDASRAWRDEVVRLDERCEALARDLDRDGVFEALEEIAAHPEIAKLLRRPAAKPRAARAQESNLPDRLRGVPQRLLPRRYRSRDGLEIWVGRSDEGNDYLSTRLARGNDLFFHLDGAPGSHVVLRTEGRPDPPSESVLDACELAVRFSKQKNTGRADVHVVPIKNVKKPKGAKRGLVYVTGGKTIHLRREEARLERVLSSRIED